jgi:hypothetical protein
MFGRKQEQAYNISTVSEPRRAGKATRRLKQQAGEDEWLFRFMESRAFSTMVIIGVVFGLAVMGAAAVLVLVILAKSAGVM